MLPAYLGPFSDQRRIILRFRWLEALTPESARAEADLKQYDGVAWQVLVQKGWIREAAPGQFYLNTRIVPRTFGERHPVRVFSVGVGLLIFALILIQLLSR